VLGEHAADRSDPEPSAMLGNEGTDQRCRGSLARTKKLVAALRISMVIWGSEEAVHDVDDTLFKVPGNALWTSYLQYL
jgi:hypothetical protein